MGLPVALGTDAELHETVMLGANRPGVTLAVRSLAGAGLVRHVRGHITVLDRAGLEAVAGGSYGVPEAEYAAFSAHRADVSEACL